MRTDSTRISEVARAAAKSHIENTYGKEFYENRYYKTKGDSQDAHEAIRPTYIELTPDSIKASLTNDQYKLYKLIYNRFIASQMANAVFETISMDIDVGEYNFKSNGQKLKFKGFMTLYVEDKDEKTDEDDESKIPELIAHEEVKKEKLDPKQSFTEPPARYTEASLVKALEEKGIGRPSTYASIISTIIDRHYIEKNQKQLVPTDLGKVVNKLLVENFSNIVNVEFTADIENQFDKVSEGEEPWKQVIREFYTPFKETLDKVDKELEHVELQAEVTDIVCEKCGKNMVVKYGRYGKFLACPGYPECKNIKPFEEKIEVPCPVCGAEVYVRKTKRGKKYFICSNNSQKLEKPCNYISWNAPKVGEKWDPSENETVQKTTKKKSTTTKKKTSATKKKSTKKKSTTKSKKQ